MDGCIDHGQAGSTCRGKRAGYSRVRYQGKVTGGHRRAYCQHYGVSLNSIEGLVVRHKCNNARCVNPEHLLLGDSFDNAQDKEASENHSRGTNNPVSVLTEQDVLRIRELATSGVKQVEIARRYNTYQGRISNIINRRIWKHV